MGSMANAEGRLRVEAFVSGAIDTLIVIGTATYFFFAWLAAGWTNSRCSASPAGGAMVSDCNVVQWLATGCWWCWWEVVTFQLRHQTAELGNFGEARKGLFSAPEQS